MFVDATAKGIFSFYIPIVCYRYMEIWLIFVFWSYILQLWSTDFLQRFQDLSVRKWFFSTNGAATSVLSHAKQWGWMCTSCHTQKLTQSRSKTWVWKLKLSEENTAVCFPWPWAWKGFSDTTPQAWGWGKERWFEPVEIRAQRSWSCRALPEGMWDGEAASEDSLAVPQ